MEKIEIKGFTISSDVEAALVVPNSGEIPQIVPPAYLFHMQDMKVLGYRGDESEMHPIFLNKDGITWYQDGALAETDFAPVETAEELFNLFNLSKKMLQSFMQSKFGLDIWTQAVGSFDVEKYIEMGEEAVKLACIAGCSPDMDAMSDDPKGEVRDLTYWKYRGIGGHIHISISEDFGDILHVYWKPLVRLLAITAGNMGIALSKYPDLERLRREQFGNACKFRLPNYPDGRKGLEYRSLSAAWLNSLESTDMVINAVKFAVKTFLEDPQDLQRLLKLYLKKSVKAVETVDTKAATKILVDIGLL